MPDRVYRDPVHGSISFDWTKERYAIDLIDCRELQRLRRIRQLGAASLVFHGAEHSRFAHSVGVAHLAKRLFAKITRDPNAPAELDYNNLQKAVIAGALLHDIGHGPFSHLFERAFARKGHEEWGLEIIDAPGTEVNDVLRKHGLLDLVKQVLDKSIRPRFVRDIISSQLDADRFDYLLRDSYMTGVTYGRFDLDWLLEVIELARIPTNGRDHGLAINHRKGFHAAEQFVIGRHLMYQQVYFHKTIRAAERVLRLVFERLVDLAKQKTLPHYCPDALARLLDADHRRLTVDAYLTLDDDFMISCFSVWSRDSSEDQVVQDLSRRYLNRQLFKTVVVDPAKIKDDLRYTSTLAALQTAVQRAGFDPRYYLAFDTAEDFPYKDMTWFVAKDKVPEDVWLAENGIATHTLSDPSISPLVNSVRNTQIAIRRLCFAAELKEIVMEHLGEYVNSGPEPVEFKSRQLQMFLQPTELK